MAKKKAAKKPELTDAQKIRDFWYEELQKWPAKRRKVWLDEPAELLYRHKERDYIDEIFINFNNEFEAHLGVNLYRPREHDQYKALRRLAVAVAKKDLYTIESRVSGIQVTYGYWIDMSEPNGDDPIFEVFAKWCGIKIEKP